AGRRAPLLHGVRPPAAARHGVSSIFRGVPPRRAGDHLRRRRPDEGLHLRRGRGFGHRREPDPPRRGAGLQCRRRASRDAPRGARSDRTSGRPPDAAPPHRAPARGSARHLGRHETRAARSGIRAAYRSGAGSRTPMGMATEQVMEKESSLGKPSYAVEITALIPVYDEAENLKPLLEKLTADLAALRKPYEILVVDDGSTDGTIDRLRELHRCIPHLRVVSFRRNYGKSAALSVGFAEARGRHLVTLDGDLQDDSAEIGPLLRKLEEGYDLVSGWKQKRKDPITKTIPSRLFNAVTSSMTGVRLHDMNCGLKAYRAEVVKTIRLRGELHRFIPVLAHWDGFRVAEVRTAHH